MRTDLAGQRAEEDMPPRGIRLVVDGVGQDGGHPAVRWRDVSMSVSVLVGHGRKKYTAAVVSGPIFHARITSAVLFC